MAIERLKQAKISKNDEFYTLYDDIQREINAYLEFNPDTFKDKVVLLPCDDPEWSNFTKFFAQNFNSLGLKKLISTSYATESKNKVQGYQFSIDDFLTDFERLSPIFNINKTAKKGKIFTLTRKNKKVDIDDLQWKYLEGDGDFRSEEITRLRDEADIIITNPPFSLFREFLQWIMDGQKKFLIIGNVNCISYKEVFPLLMDNKIWAGCRFNERVNGKNQTFRVPDSYPLSGTELYVGEDGKKYISVAGTAWFTNLEHGRRHQPVALMNLKDNIKYSSHKEIRNKGYSKYDNYDAIEVPYTDAIPSDYDGNMGVPITFIKYYCPEQFEILGLAPERARIGKEKNQIKRYENAIQHNPDGTTQSGNKVNDGPAILYKNLDDLYENNSRKKPYYTAEGIDGYLAVQYARIIIRRKNSGDNLKNRFND